MKTIKLLLLTGALLYASTALAQTRQIIMVEILLNRGIATIGTVTNGQGYISEPEKELEMGPYQYWLEVISSSGQILEMRKFGLDNRVFPRPPYPEEISEPVNADLIDHISKIISLPYYADIKMLNLYDANRNLLEQKDVSYLIPGCGDGKCANKENYLTCAQDCSAGGQDGWCNKGLSSTDPDCQKIPPAAKESTPKLYTWLVASGLLISLIIIGLGIYIMRKKETENF